MLIQYLMHFRHCGGQVVEGFKHQLNRISEQAMDLERSAKSQDRL